MGIGTGVKVNDNFLTSKKYENTLDIDTKKLNGVYYTPKVVVDYIMLKTLKQHDIVKNPYPKIIDISCGCGNFLLEAYDVLYDMFEENIYELKGIYNDDYWKTDNIHNHIISNCIYGVDIDNNAIEILKDGLRKKDEDLHIDKMNLYCEDSLKYQWHIKFDYIVGNPPYVGHKSIDREYKKYLLENYPRVYKDKSDMYFCFYEKIIELLNDKGIASVITPRYFLESPSGRSLRDFMKENIKIIEIVDFLGSMIFKNIGVASCIMTFSKEKNSELIDIYRIKDENININKEYKNKYYDLSNLINSDLFEYFQIGEENLNKNWMIANKEVKLFHEKIEAKCNYTLGDIVESFQGIITGCDKAFILNEDDKRLDEIDINLIKNWVKNKNINKYTIEPSTKKLIYSNDIDDEKKYKSTIRECIAIYKEKLSNRRECKRNIRKWYELQWGREKSLFEREKIMYPYKSRENRFAVDYYNNFSSADVYSFFIKEQYKMDFSHEYLVGILNSSIYDKYYKITAKKMSKNVYDYYPNKVMGIKIFKDENYEEIEALSKEIIRLSLNKNNIKSENIKYIDLQDKIDNLVAASLQVNH